MEERPNQFVRILRRKNPLSQLSLFSAALRRPGPTYEYWHHHPLDRALLTVLQEKMK
jgi:hypothetical protein